MTDAPENLAVSHRREDEAGAEQRADAPITHAGCRGGGGPDRDRDRAGCKQLRREGRIKE